MGQSVLSAANLIIFFYPLRRFGTISPKPSERFLFLHYFILEDMDDGKTHFIHGENFQGLLASPILRKIENATLKGFEGMNLAIKEIAEKTI